ncbi:MAG: DMT family transporter [Lachnospiraceae bacterium]|nr:DMT family transporter [Lachnospiraceae bacterium]
MIGFFIALISGTLMSVQGVFNTEVTKQSSVWVSASWVQFSALLTCLAIWAIFDRTSLLMIGKVSPRYMLLGGIFGAFITYTVIQSMSALGPAKATMLIVIAQLTVSWLIELFSLFGVDKGNFSWRKLMGLLIAVVGVILFEWES